MAEAKKYDRILNALQQLMIDKSMSNISVSDIAVKAGIGKGSIYYYFPSKEAILDALIRRNYEAPCRLPKSWQIRRIFRPLRGWPCCFRHAEAPPQLS